jgi:hypothetical protein
MKCARTIVGEYLANDCDRPGRREAATVHRGRSGQRRLIAPLLPVGVEDCRIDVTRNSSGSLAIFAAIRRASSRVSGLSAARGSSK